MSLVFYWGLLGHKHKIHRIKAKKTNLAMKPTILNAIFIFEKETAIVQHFVQIYISMFSKCAGNAADCMVNNIPSILDLISSEFQLC